VEDVPLVDHTVAASTTVNRAALLNSGLPQPRCCPWKSPSW